MKTITTIRNAFILLSIGLLGFTSCKKDQSITADDELALAKQEAIAIAMNSTVIGSSAVGDSKSASTSGSEDSLYVMEACKKGNRRAEIPATSVRAEIHTYLTANYSGYTFFKAFKITNATSSIDSYVVIILFNNKPVALKFDASGTFVRVLELREGRDLRGRGWHLGGWFEHRDGKHRDTIAISALPAAIKLYFTANYSQDTIAHAFANKDNSIIVVSKNNGFFATAFNANGLFIRRIQLPCSPGRGQDITVTEIRAEIQTYLAATYPNYVVKKAFVVKTNGVVKGYLVLIDANLTKYAIHFNASGQFVAAVAIR